MINGDKTKEQTSVNRKNREFIKDLPIASEWCDEKNIDKFRAGSEYRAQWRCQLGHIWKMPICSRTKGKSNCPYCANKKVWVGFNDLSTKFPKILHEWNDLKDPSTVLATGAYVAQWRCQLGHVWKTKVAMRTVQKNNCPYCGNKKLLKGFNDFATKYPEIAKEWHPTKNPKASDSFIMDENKRYWWICTLGHEYKATCKHRAKRKQGCSICAGKTIVTGYNDLATERPELVKEWDYCKNVLNPTEIAVYRNSKAFWVCSISECKHKWEASIANRARGAGCPKCSGAVSQEEKAVLKFIESIIPKTSIIPNDKTVIKPKEIDIFIPELKLGIEYNGIYWHNKKRYLNDLANNTLYSPEHQKTLLCKEKGIDLIHIWSDDWKQKTECVKNYINKCLTTGAR